MDVNPTYTPDLQFTDGKETGLGVQGAWIFMFEHNERRKLHSMTDQPLSDQRIAVWMTKEFPNHQSKLFEDLRNREYWRVQQVRSRYNRGGLTRGVRPKIQSHRYNENGEYDDPRHSGKASVQMGDTKQALSGTMRPDGASFHQKSRD